MWAAAVVEAEIAASTSENPLLGVAVGPADEANPSDAQDG